MVISPAHQPAHSAPNPLTQLFSTRQSADQELNPLQHPLLWKRCLELFVEGIWERLFHTGMWVRIGLNRPLRLQTAQTLPPDITSLAASLTELKPAALSSDTNDQWRAGDDAALGSAR